MSRKVSVVIMAIVAVVMMFSVSRADAWEPLGYPYSTWGELSHSEIEGLKIDGYLEQGIDMFRIPNIRLVLNFFGAFRFTESDRYMDTWNNKISPIVGAKLKLPIGLPDGHWGQLDFGVRGEQVFHHASHARDTLQVVIFARWGFGGDWKKR